MGVIDCRSVFAVVILWSAAGLSATDHPCDPNIDFYVEAAKAKPYQNFDEDWLLDKRMYLSRSYLSPSENVTNELYDYSTIATTRAGEPNKEFWEFYSRSKDKMYCNEARQGFSIRIRKGVHEWHLTPGRRAFSTYIYVNEGFVITLFCRDVNAAGDRCGDYGINFWSDCPVPDPRDIARGERILKGMCYPDMKRFIDGKHELDCSSGGADYCQSRKRCLKLGRWRKTFSQGKCDCGGRNDDDDDDDDDMRGWKRRRYHY